MEQSEMENALGAIGLTLSEAYLIDESKTKGSDDDPNVDVVEFAEGSYAVPHKNNPDEPDCQCILLYWQNLVLTMQSCWIIQTRLYVAFLLESVASFYETVYGLHTLAEQMRELAKTLY